jgi:PAS domain S-box-containing protein
LGARLFEASPAYLDIYECSLAEIPVTADEFIERLVDPENGERERVRALLASHTQGQTLTGECRVRLANGKRKWVQFSYEPLLGANGERIGYRGIARDVTEEREAQRRLQETTMLLREAHRIAKVGHFHWELSSDRLTLSDDFNEIFQLPATKRFETMTQWMEYVVLPSDKDVVAQNLLRIAQGLPYHVIRRVVLPDNRMRYLEARGMPQRDVSGRVYAYRGTVRDITDQHSQLLQLTRSEERFRRLTELSSDWYWEQDAQHRFTFLSREETVTTKLPAKVVLGKTRWELFPQALSASEWAAHRAVLDARQPFFDLVTRAYAEGDPDPIGYFSISGAPVFNEQGDFVGYRGVGRDVTKRKLAERALAAKSAELLLANEALQREAARREQLEKSLLLVIESAMTRAGSQLHEELGQDLTGIALLAKSLETKLRSTSQAAAGDAAYITDLVNRSIQQTRLLSNSLSPNIIGDSGLVPALHQFAADTRLRHRVEFMTRLDDDIQISDDIASRLLYRITQDVVGFAVQHAGASKLWVSLRRGGGVVLLTVGSGQWRSGVSSTQSSLSDAIAQRARTIGATVRTRHSDAYGNVVRISWPAMLAPPANATPPKEKSEK